MDMRGLLLKGYEKIVTFGRSGKDTTTIDEIKDFVSDGLSNDFIKNSDKGKPHGVASLDSSGKVPSNQLPASSGGGGGDFSLVEYNSKDHELLSNTDIIFTSYGDVSNIVATGNIPLGNITTINLDITNPVTSEQYRTEVKYSEYTSLITSSDFGEINFDFTGINNAHVFVSMLRVDQNPPFTSAMIKQLFLYPPEQTEYTHVNNSGVGIAQRPKIDGISDITIIDSWGNFANKQVGDNLSVSLSHGVLLDKLAEIQGITVSDLIESLNQLYPRDQVQRIIEDAKNSRFISGSLNSQQYETYETTGDVKIQVIIVPMGVYNQDTGNWSNLTVENMSGEVTVSHTFKKLINTVPTGLSDGTYLKINGDANIDNKILKSGDFIQVYENDKIIIHRQ